MSSFETLCILGKKRNASNSYNISKIASEPADKSDFYGHYNAIENGYSKDPGIEYNLKQAIERLLNARDFVNQSEAKEFTRKELNFTKDWFAILNTDTWYDGKTGNKFTLTPTRIETFKFRPYGVGKEINGKRYYYSRQSVLDFIRDSLEQIKENNGLDIDIRDLEYEINCMQEKINRLKVLQYVLEHC